MLAMVFVMMLVSLVGCYWVYVVITNGDFQSLS